MTLNLLQMIGFIVQLVGLPQSPDDAQPAVSQAAVGMVLGVTAATTAGEVGGGPMGMRDGGDGELLGGVAIGAVAGFAEADEFLVAALDGDGAGTGQGADGGRGGEAVAVVAKHDQELGGQELAGAGQRVKDGLVGVLEKEVMDLPDFLTFVAPKL